MQKSYKYLYFLQNNTLLSEGERLHYTKEAAELRSRRFKTALTWGDISRLEIKSVSEKQHFIN